ncbi:unnamed protein product [Moneuplotes crassus]|uniref:Zinc finger Sec23/Sec24-type domain-containing protein n=1 Tax=Euplotes crassus TaxID=5936 RepID=A0AAD1X4T0_EUPCR|nr:unnamed protein product [Moneuplotes crassus]
MIGKSTLMSSIALSTLMMKVLTHFASIRLTYIIDISVPKKVKKRVKKQGRKFKNDVDTNVMKVNMSALEPEDFTTGDPVFCTNCSAVLNVHSHLEQHEAEGDDNESRVWICEFCNNKNEINLDEHEVPDKESGESNLNYILEKPEDEADEHKQDEEIKGYAPDVTRDSSETPLIFCIDMSSSMNNSVMPLDKGDRSLTRYQCLAKGICDQIEAFKEANKKVGIVYFCSYLAVCGDGTAELKEIRPGEALNNEEYLYANAENLAMTHMSQPVSLTHENLIAMVKKKKPRGMTALGPGALTAITMAGAVGKGATVVICTDGETNLGVGSQTAYKETSDWKERVDKFYEDLAANANEHGVTVNLMSLKGCYCNLDNLIVLSEETGGQVNIIDPQDASNEFETMLQVKPIATNVTVKVRLHQALEFKNELSKNLSADRTLMTKKLGNVNANTEVTFSYRLKDPDQLALIEGFNIEEFSKIPFQTQIEYCRLDGTKYLRVISRVLETSSDAEEVKQDLNIGIVAVNAAQQASNLAREGRFREAQALSYNNKKFIKKIAKTEEDTAMYKAFKGSMRQMYNEVHEQSNKEDMVKLRQEREKEPATYQAKPVRSDALTMNVHNMRSLTYEALIERSKE